MDRWDRKTDFGCRSCMFYVPKLVGLPDGTGGVKWTASEGRCRRSAPTMKGYPVVFANDWCGEHKRGSNPIRDASPTIDQPLAFDPERTIPTADEKKEPQASEPAIVMDGTAIPFDFVINPEEKAKIKGNIISLTSDIHVRVHNTAPQTDISYIAGKIQIIRELLEKL